MWFARQKVDMRFSSPLRIVYSLEPGAPLWRAIFTWKIQGLTIRGENMASTITTGTSATAKVAWVDAGGNPATVDGPTAWASSDTAIATVEANATDSTEAQVVSVGPIGPAQLQATADADMGSGVQTITAMLDLTVIAGQASAGTITLTPN
jgi:hypothetical protein